MINNSCSVLDSQSNLQPNPNQGHQTGATSQGIVVISPLDDLETGEDLATTGDLDITDGPINIDFDDINQVFDVEIQPQDGKTATITKIEISSNPSVDSDGGLVKVSSRATATNTISPNPLAKGNTTRTGDSGGGVVMVSSSTTATSTISDNPLRDLSDRSDNTSEDLSIRVAWPKANPIVSIHGTAMVSSTISNPNTNNYQISGAATVTISEDIVGTITNPIDSLLDSFLTPSLFTPSLLTSSLGFPSSRIDLDQSRSRSVGL
ncbi:hypothetical protein BJP36_05900 [Moorena producens JHB]|uniref:Uncharacterized protein n=1 Tax=Moorena producens (strain JHB) TaxID=1454205 RepID=A0A1D9FWI7_MOOP1|nr:hypothetical protein [Moorena producens]AOY79520.2 hypothetical protein BJP36_05900 [Moorena producens JHB]